MASGTELQDQQRAARETMQSILRLKRRAELSLRETKQALELRTAELANSLALLSATLESTRDGVIAHDPQGRVVATNGRLAQLWGMPPDVMASGDHAAICRHMEQLVEDSGHFASVVQAVEQGHASHAFDHVKLRDGRQFERYVVPLVVDQARQGVVVSWRDVTAQRRTDDALRLSAAALDSAQGPDRIGNWELDIQSRRCVCSAQCFELLGRDPEAGDPSLDDMLAMVHVQDAQAVQRAYEDAMVSGGRLEHRFRLVLPGGTLRWVLAHAEVKCDALGKPVRVVGSLRDINERVFAQQQRLLLETAVARLSDIVLITEAEPLGDPGPRIVFVNEAFSRRTGYSREEAIGRSPRFLQGPLTDKTELRRMGEALRRWEPVRCELVNYTKSGEAFWLELDIVPIADETGWYTHWVAIERDITERREAERRLREQEQTLSAVISQASDAIISADGAGRITLFNPAAEYIFGQSAERALGQPLTQYFRSAYRAQPRPGARVAGGKRKATGATPADTRRMKGLHSQGHVLELEVSMSEVTLNDQQMVTAIVRDVTDRTRSEAALVQYQLELSSLTQQLMAQEKETANRLAQALHDQLGQTLTALQLSFDTLQAGLEADTARSPQAVRQGIRIQGLIEQAVREVRQVLVDLRPPLLDEMGLAAALDNEILHRPDLEGPLKIKLDVALQAQRQRWSREIEYAAFMVAREAIGNAIRHADASRIDVRLDGEAGWLLLEVVDNGHGMAQQDQVPRHGHLGLVGMRERANAIRARVDLQSPAHGGVCVTLRWEATA